MKKNIKFVFAQLIFLLMIFLLHAVPEHVEGPYTDLFLYAKSLHNAGAYDQAEVEYKRYIFMQNYVLNQDENLTDAFWLWKLREQTHFFLIIFLFFHI